MSTKQTGMILKLMKIVDSLIMAGAFGLATLAVLAENQGVHLGNFLSLRIKIQNIVLFVLFLILWRLAFSGLRLYDPARNPSRHADVAEAVEATSICAVILGVGSIVFDIGLVDPVFFLAFWTSSSIGVALFRVVLVYLSSHAQRDRRALRNVLMVGTSPRVIAFARKLEARQDLGYRVIGFVDEDWSGLEDLRATPYRLVCHFDGIANFLRRNVIDGVVVGLPLPSHHETVTRIAAVCEAQGIVVHFLPFIAEPTVARYVAEDFEGNPLISLYSGPNNQTLLLAKRVMDIVISFVALIVLSPLMAVVALAIRLASPGPVIFGQQRLGLNKRLFRLYKFRTMVQDAEQRQAELEGQNEVGGPVFKIKDDPRIFPLGKFLRKTSLDELPQLFNVLKGDMSLVGPRPLPVRDYQGFNQDWHRRRFSVRPGITCFWQMSGRSSISFDKWMELDMRYIDEWSIWLDLQIMVGTIPAVLKGSGAA